MKIMIINGPNLNLLGTREPEIYGSETLDAINRRLVTQAKAQGADLEAFQSNHEGELIDRVHAARSEGIEFILLNPGGYTHTSVALRDALLGSHLAAVEVHISNLYKREEFRHTSLTAPACLAVISGLGLEGYHAAIRFLLKR